MDQVRIDPLSGHRVIVAPGRADRPGGRLTAVAVPDPEPDNDPFAPGHERETALEVQALRDDGSAPDGPGWQARAVPNRWPVLTADAATPERDAVPDLFWAGAAKGAHEVIVNSPRPVASLAALTTEEIVAAVDLWRSRMRAHPDAACLHLVVNEGEPAGSSQRHTHAQLYALDFVPADIARERERFTGYAARTMGGNLLADLVQQEVRRRERIVAIDSEGVLMTAFAGRFPFEMLLAPRTARMRFQDDGPTCAALLRDALRRLGRVFGAVPPLNLWIRTAPSGAEHFCWHIEIVPRLVSLGGLELGAGVYLNPIAPETAAAQLREA